MEYAVFVGDETDLSRFAAEAGAGGDELIFACWDQGNQGLWGAVQIELTRFELDGKGGLGFFGIIAADIGSQFGFGRRINRVGVAGVACSDDLLRFGSGEKQVFHLCGDIGCGIEGGGIA